MNDGGGNHHCLDLSRATTEDAPVVFWDHEHEDGPQQVPSDWAPSFSAWLEVRLREATDKASGEGG